MSEEPSRLERIAFFRLEMWAVVCLVLAALIGGVVWGVAMIKYSVFPANAVRELAISYRGLPSDERPWLTRILSGNIFLPRSFPAPTTVTVLPESAFGPVSVRRDLGSAMPVSSAMSIANPGGELRYFVIYGSFVFPEVEETVGTIAIDSTGVIHRAWPANVEGAETREHHIGLAVSPDGIVATNTDGIMTAYSWCGGKLWQAPWKPSGAGNDRPDYNGPLSYDWHHDIEWYNGVFYSFRGMEVLGVSEQTGKIVDSLHGVDLYHWGWKDDLNLVDARGGRFDAADLTPETAGDLLPRDPFHMNKVDVLTANEVDAYPGLKVGDLLLSLRDLNLVLIVRPEEKRIVWWRYGLTSRQHDATFVDGAIEVFDNAPFTSDPPRPTIRRLSYSDYRSDVVLDLSQWKVVQRYGGNFEHREDRILTVDHNSGRMIAGRTNGTIDVEFRNGFDADGDPYGTLVLQNATEIDPMHFEALEAACED